MVEKFSFRIFWQRNFLVAYIIIYYFVRQLIQPMIITEPPPCFIVCFVLTFFPIVESRTTTEACRALIDVLGFLDLLDESLVHFCTIRHVVSMN